MIRTRLAPSPTGYPHIGTIYQALFDYVYARKEKGGAFVLRIEDTDRKRRVEGSEEMIYDSLRWFGLEADEGPKKGGKFGPYRQSERLTLYKKYARLLMEKGKAYPCFCSEERLKKMRESSMRNGRTPMYDGKCRTLTAEQRARYEAAGKKYVIRMKVPEKGDIIVRDLLRGKIKFRASTIDDQVLLKSDGFPTYHFAVVVDDHLMKITHAIRGEEYLSSFPKHTLLYKYFGWKEPVWIHLPILRNPDRSKMSKRMGHTPVDWYRKQGYLPEAILNFLALTIWGRDKGKEVFSVKTLIKEFRFEDIRIAAPVFDLKKLDWLNGVYIRNLSEEELKNRLLEFNPKLKKADGNIFNKVLPLVKDRLKKLNEFDDVSKYFFSDIDVGKDKIREMILIESKVGESETGALFEKVAESLNLVGDLEWKAENIDNVLHAVLEELNLKPRQFFMPIRIAVTGKSVSPPLGATLEVLGKSVSIDRISKAGSFFE